MLFFEDKRKLTNKTGTIGVLDTIGIKSEAYDIPRCELVQPSNDNAHKVQLYSCGNYFSSTSYLIILEERFMVVTMFKDIQYYNTKRYHNTLNRQ